MNMARLVSATDRVAKRGLEEAFLTAKESSDVQQMASYGEQMFQLVGQARAAVEAWRSPTEAAEMRKLSRMLARFNGGK